MADHPISRCRDCQAAIIWTLTVANQRRMPVDAVPIVGGNVVLTSGNDGPEARVVTRDEAERNAANRRPLHVSHFTTCPNAAGRRKR